MSATGWLLSSDPAIRWQTLPDLADAPAAEVSLLALLLLRDMGLDPASPQACEAIALVRDHATWHSRGPWHGTPVFAGEVEPCINGRVVVIGAYYSVDVSGIVERLLAEQQEDGGWNCERENGSTRGSFHTTISVLEAFLVRCPPQTAHCSGLSNRRHRCGYRRRAELRPLIDVHERAWPRVRRRHDVQDAIARTSVPSPALS